MLRRWCAAVAAEKLARSIAHADGIRNYLSSRCLVASLHKLTLFR
jgi:hypothetical protein